MQRLLVTTALFLSASASTYAQHANRHSVKHKTLAAKHKEPISEEVIAPQLPQQELAIDSTLFLPGKGHPVSITIQTVIESSCSCDVKGHGLKSVISRIIQLPPHGAFTYPGGIVVYSDWIMHR